MEPHPSPAELEAEVLPAEVAAHLERCPACRVDRRLLLGEAEDGPGEPASRARLGSALRTLVVEAPVPDPAEEAVGAVRYVLGARIGGGASGEVLRAHDPLLRRDLALKVLHRTGSGARGRFVAEAQCTAQLEHPNIVPVHHLGTTPDGRPFLAMKEVHGLSLAEAVRAGRLATVEARVDVLRRVCDALSFAHHKGVIHRDLKPENVMVGEFGEVLVVDWGLARPIGGAHGDDVVHADRFEAAADRTREGQVAGTPAYMAPEQARGENTRLDARTDVYALGGILHFLLVGRPPVPGGSGEAALEAARAGRVEHPRDVDPTVPRELDAIVRRAMAPDPARRYPDARHLREDLDAWSARLPLPHVGSSWAERASKFASRQRAAVRGVGATLLVAAVVLLAASWRYTGQLEASRRVAEGEAQHAVQAERAAVRGAAAANVALAESRMDQGRELEAEEALAAAAQALAAIDGDTRSVDMAQARLRATTAHAISTCLPVGRQPPMSLAVAPDGTAAAAVGADGRVVVWDPAGCAVLATADFGAPVETSAAAWLADGPALVAITAGELVQLRPERGVLARSPVPGRAAGEPGNRIGPHGVSAIGLSESGAGWVAQTGGAWSSFRFGRAELDAGTPFRGDVWDLVSEPEADLLYVKFVDRVLPSALWSKRGGRMILEVDPRGMAIASADGTRAWVQTPEQIRAVELGTGATRWAVRDGGVGSIDLAPGGRRLVGWGERYLSVYDAETGLQVGRGVFPTKARAVAVGRDARVVVVLDGEGQASTLLPPARPRAPIVSGGATSNDGLAQSADGQLLALGGDDEVLVLDAATGAVLRRWPTGGDPHEVVFSDDDARVAAVSRGGTLQVWDVGGGEELARRTLAHPAGNVAWTGPDELALLDDTGELRVLAAADLSERAHWRVRTTGSRCVAPVPGTRLLVVSGYLGDDDGVVVELDSGRVLHRLPQAGARYHLGVSAGGLASVPGFDGVDLWDTRTGAVVRNLAVAVGPSLGSDFSPDGALVAAAGWDGTVRIWDVATGVVLHTARLANASGGPVRFTPDGDLLALSGSWTLERVPLDLGRRGDGHARALGGGHADRAAAFAALGWWERVIPELDAGADDPRLRARALLALGRPEEAARAARGMPAGVYRALLGGG